MQLELPFCQRWRNGRAFYRPRGEPIDTSRYSVEPVETGAAKAFVVREHYSRSFPADRARIGLFEVGRGLVGVAVFSVPMNPATVPRYARGTEPRLGIELGRFVLLNHVAANGETWMLGQAFRLVRRLIADIEVVISFSDPVRRTTADGRIVLPGHVGQMYRAHNGRYVGRTSPHRLLLAPDGRAVSPRALSKVRGGERGGLRGGYVHEQLLSMGAPAWPVGETGEGYVARVIRSGVFRTLAHPGNHAFVWAIGSRSRRRDVTERFPPALPYPKTIDLVAARAGVEPDGVARRGRATGGA